MDTPKTIVGTDPDSERKFKPHTSYVAGPFADIGTVPPHADYFSGRLIPPMAGPRGSVGLTPVARRGRLPID